MKRMLIIVSLFICAPALAKDKPEAVVRATEARDAAKAEVLRAQVTLAEARAKLAEASAALARAKRDAKVEVTER